MKDNYRCLKVSVSQKFYRNIPVTLRNRYEGVGVSVLCARYKLLDLSGFQQSNIVFTQLLQVMIIAIVRILFLDL